MTRWTSEAVDAGMSRWKQARDEEVYAPRAVELAIEAALAVFPVGEPDYKDQSIEQVRRWREQEAGEPDDERLEASIRKLCEGWVLDPEPFVAAAVAAVRAAREEKDE